MSNNISKKIKELREQNNITQNKLANDLIYKTTNGCTMGKR